MKRCVKNGVIKNKFKKGTKIVKIYFKKIEQVFKDTCFNYKKYLYQRIYKGIKSG